MRPSSVNVKFLFLQRVSYMSYIITFISHNTLHHIRELCNGRVSRLELTTSTRIPGPGIELRQRCEVHSLGALMTVLYSTIIHYMTFWYIILCYIALYSVILRYVYCTVFVIV